MADFFRGLSGGFQTGLQMGQAIRERNMRDDLAQAYGLKPEEVLQRQATPEELARAQAETQALAAQDAEMFGLTADQARSYAPAAPVEGQRVGLPTYRLGEQTFQQAPTQAQIDTARGYAAADVYGRYGDTARREELRRGLRAEERAQAAETRAQTGFETQQQLAGLQIKRGQREETAQQRADDFSAWAQQNPELANNFQASMKKATELGMSSDEKLKAASALTGIGEAEFKSSQQAIRKLTQNQGLDGLLKAHRESDLLDPGSHFETIRGKDGTVTLNRVDTATGKVIQPNVFSGKEAEVVGYLNKAASDPAAVIEYTLNMEKLRTQIDASRASAEKDRATVGYYGTRGGLDKMGAAQYFTGADGNTYAAVPTMTKEGLKFDTVRVNPEGIKLAKPGTDGAGDKPVKTPEAGEKYTIQGKPMQADGLGGFISTRGVLPDDRAKAMAKLEIPDNYIGRLQWSNDGESVLFGDTRYSMVGKEAKSEVKQLLKDIEAADVMTQRIKEANKQRMNPPNVLTGLDGTGRTTGFGPALTYPGR